MEACVVICRTSKPKPRRGRILFINAIDEVTRQRGQSFLTDEHLDRIVRSYRAFVDDAGFARVVSLEEIRSRDANLSIPLYVSPPSKTLESSSSDDRLPDALSAWLDSSARVRTSIRALLGQTSSGPKASR